MTDPDSHPMSSLALDAAKALVKEIVARLPEEATRFSEWWSGQSETEQADIERVLASTRDHLTDVAASDRGTETIREEGAWQVRIQQLLDRSPDAAEAIRHYLEQNETVASESQIARAHDINTGGGNSFVGTARDVTQKTSHRRVNIRVGPAVAIAAVVLAGTVTMYVTGPFNDGQADGHGRPSQDGTTAITDYDDPNDSQPTYKVGDCVKGDFPPRERADCDDPLAMRIVDKVDVDAECPTDSTETDSLGTDATFCLDKWKVGACATSGPLPDLVKCDASTARYRVVKEVEDRANCPGSASEALPDWKDRYACLKDLGTD